MKVGPAVVADTESRLQPSGSRRRFARTGLSRKHGLVVGLGVIPGLVLALVATSVGKAPVTSSSSGTTKASKAAAQQSSTVASVAQYQAAKAAALAAAPAAPTPKLSVLAATTSLSSNGPKAGTPLTHFKWLLNLDNSGNATNGLSQPNAPGAAYSQNCHPTQSNPDGSPKLDPVTHQPVLNPMYPDGAGNIQSVPDAPLYGTSVYDGGGHFHRPDPTTSACPWPSLHYELNSPVISEGDETNWNSNLALPAFDGTHGLPPGKYLISVTADSYQIGGAHFTICPTADDPTNCPYPTPITASQPQVGPGIVVVGLNPYPLPLGTIVARAFADIAPTQGTYAATDPNLPNFHAALRDYDAIVSADYYGNAICTQYRTDRNGVVLLGPSSTPASTTYTATTATDTALNMTLNTTPGMFAGALIQARGASGETHGTILHNTATTITLDAAGWSNGMPTQNTGFVVNHGNPVPQDPSWYGSAADTSKPSTPGNCLTGTDGIVRIPNLAANRYSIELIPPQSQQGRIDASVQNWHWVEDFTLEGSHDHDVWLMADATGLDTEQVIAGEPQPFVNFSFAPSALSALPNGFVGAGSTVTYRATGLTDTDATWNPHQWQGATIKAGDSTAVIADNTVNTLTLSAPWAPLTPSTAEAYAIAMGTPATGEITGQLMGSNNYVPGLNGIPGIGGASGASGIKLDSPPKGGWVALSDLTRGTDGQMVYSGPTDANGKFDIKNVPDGDYSLTFWDQPQDYALDQVNVTIAHGQAVDTGVLPLLRWFTRISGKVCVDLNGNGRCDPGEPGVPQFLMQNLNRTNNTYEQGQNTARTDLNGNYEFSEAYPLGQFTTEQFFNTRYKSTGLTYQACNDPQEHTIISPFVDVQFLPIIGQCARIDVAVQPYNPSAGGLASGDNGGIVATMLYDSIRMTYPARQNIQFDHMTGIPGFAMDLYTPATGTPDRKNPVGCYPNASLPALACGDVLADGTWVDAMGYVHNKDGSYHTAEASPLNANGRAASQSYITEHSGPPTSCMPQDANGNTVNNVTQNAVGVPGSTPGYTPRCTESSLQGVGVGGGTDNTQVFKPDSNPAINPATPACAVGQASTATAKCIPLHGIQTVDGNYGLDATDASLCNVDATGSPVFTQTPGCFKNHPGDFIVYANVPRDNVLPGTGGYNTPLFTMSSEADVNIFSGDQWVPQNSNPTMWPPTVVNVPQVPTGVYGENPGTSSPGPNPQCTAAMHQVHVTNPDFLAVGGSPLEGQWRNSCQGILIRVEAGQSVAPNFHVHTVNDVPIPGKFSGYIVDDVSASTDRKSTMLGEVSGIAGAPIGIYDWTNTLQYTATSDYNGQYELLMPSTQNSNCLTPAGVCANIYRFVGNDPGQPPSPNVNYRPQYRTIAANFQDWPGQFLAADVAPTKAITNLEAAGAQFAYPPACNPALGSPQLFSVDRPYRLSSESASSRILTIKGLSFGQIQGTGHVNLAGYTTISGTPVDLPVVSWTDTKIQVRIPNSTSNPALQPGPYQLTVTNSGNLTTTQGVTFHLVGGTSYNPTIYAVGPPDNINLLPSTPGLNHQASGSVASNPLSTSYSASTATDTSKNMPVNAYAGATIVAQNSAGTAATYGTVASNSGQIITLTSAGWSSGPPTNGTQFFISPTQFESSDTATYTATTATDPTLSVPPGAALVGDLITATSSGTDIGTAGIVQGYNAATHTITLTAAGWNDGRPANGTAAKPNAFTIWLRQPTSTRIQDALEAIAGSESTSMPDPGLPMPGTLANPVSKPLIIVYPANPAAFSPQGTYYENLLVHSPAKVQGVGPGGLYGDSTSVPGTRIDGRFFWSTNTLPDATGNTPAADAGPAGFETGTNEPYAAAWLTLAENVLNHGEGSVEEIGWDGNRNIIEGAVVDVVAKASGPLAPTATYPPAFDGAYITGGDQKDFPGNFQEAFGFKTSGVNEGTATDETLGTLEVQGGGFFINAYDNYYHVTNNFIQGNSGTYGGAIRVGTPYVNTAPPNDPNHGAGDDAQGQVNDHVMIAHNQILGNGGTNLAGAIGLFSGTNGYRITQNTLCGNYTIEYGGAISHFGLSGFAQRESNPATTTYATVNGTATAKDTSLNLTPNAFVGAVLTSVTATATTEATVASNTTNTFTLTAAGWDHGAPANGISFKIALAAVPSTTSTTFTAYTANDPSLHMPNMGHDGIDATGGIISSFNSTTGALTTGVVASVSSTGTTVVLDASKGWSNGTPSNGARFTVRLVVGTIDHNKIYLNGSNDEGGALMIAGEAPPAGTAGGVNSGGGSPIPGGLSTGAGSVVIDSNKISANVADDDGGGIRFLMGGSAPQRVTNNFINNNVSSHEGGGISIDDTPHITIDHNTIARNVTTATATTSNGAPAPAGISTARNSALLQSTLPPGSSVFSNPTITNNILWDNRAGSWASGGVAGIGLNGDPTPVNVWDVGTADESGLLTPQHSLIDTPTTAVEGCNGCTPNGSPNGSGNWVGVNPNFPNSYVTQIDVLQIRTYFRFRPSAIVSINAPSDAFGDYSSSYNTSAGLGAVIPGGLQ